MPLIAQNIEPIWLKCNENVDKRLSGHCDLMALKLLGGDVISEIGIYDLNRNLAERWERELNQMAYPEGGDLPEVRILEESEIFDCDVFVFAATASVPPVMPSLAAHRTAS